MLVITSIYSWKYHVWFSLTILLSWVAWIVAYLTHMNLPQPWFHIIQLCKKKQLLIMVKRLTMANIWLISSSLTSWSVMFTALLGQYMYQLRAWWCDWVWSSTFLCGRECRLSQSHTCFSTTTGHIPSFSPSLSVSVSLPLSVSFSHTHTLSLCVSVCLSLSVSIFVFLSLSISLSVCLSVSLTLSLSLSLFVSLSLSLSPSSISFHPSLSLPHPLPYPVLFSVPFYVPFPHCVPPSLPSSHNRFCPQWIKVMSHCQESC